MDAPDEKFNTYRPRLFGIAYRMLGSRTKVPSFRKVVRGSDPVTRIYAGFSRKFNGRLVYRLAEINGEPGLLRYLEGKLESAQSFVIDGNRIRAIYAVRNPDKLKDISLSP